MSDLDGINKDFHPDAILVLDIKMHPENLYKCNGNIYKCIDDFNDKANCSAWIRTKD